MPAKPTSHPTLESPRIRLEPLEPSHVEGLMQLFDPAIWKWYFNRVHTPQDLREMLERNLDDHRAGTAISYAVRDRETGKIAGHTRFLSLAPEHRRLEIGSTWYGTAYQRTHVNT